MEEEEEEEEEPGRDRGTAPLLRAVQTNASERCVSEDARLDSGRCVLPDGRQPPIRHLFTTVSGQWDTLEGASEEETTMARASSGISQNYDADPSALQTESMGSGEWTSGSSRLERWQTDLIGAGEEDVSEHATLDPGQLEALPGAGWESQHGATPIEFQRSIVFLFIGVLTTVTTLHTVFVVALHATSEIDFY
eukprot:1744930-Rhodomonas_salina.2